MKEQLDKIEKHLRSLEHLRLDGVDEIDDSHELYFLIRYLIRQGVGNRTVYARTDKTQCYGGAFRSLGDLYRIALHYRECSLYDFTKHLMRLCCDQEIGWSFCPDIQDRVFMEYNLNKTITIINDMTIDNTCKLGIDGLDLLNFKNSLYEENTISANI